MLFFFSFSFRTIVMSFAFETFFEKKFRKSCKYAKKNVFWMRFQKKAN